MRRETWDMGRVISNIFRNRRIAWTATLVSAAVIMALSLTPKPDPHGVTALGDKTAHVLGYVALAFLLAHSLSLSGWRGLRLAAAASVLCGLYGMMLEGLQFFVPLRTPELGDALANVLGACLGAGVSYRRS